jgi:DNA-binding NtrC family response regulator
MSKSRILVVDDERSLREFLTILLGQAGYDVTTAESVESGIAALEESSFDLAMCDLKLPDGSGLSVLEEARNRQLETPFIIITAHTTPQHALESMRAGAAEYLSKPFDVEELKLIIGKLLPEKDSASLPVNLPQFIGSSAPMQRILEMVPQVAVTPTTVLVTGESGTGKELLARAIHAGSAQAAGPFLTVNCGALPEGLLESELFGHVRGAFTGAVRDHNGLFAQADGGTLFLDEIGELTPPMQVKLLRVLQEHRVRPVGGQREVEVNVRILSATNRDLQNDVEEGRFREDLYYRLNVIHLHLPPLRQRSDDIPALARHFARLSCRRFNLADKRLTSDTLRVLQAYNWPGNVRELENVIERTVALERSEIISSGSLPEHIRGAPADRHVDHVVLPEQGIDLEEYLNSIRRLMMRQALRRADGQQKKAAELLRLSYRAFRYHAEKLGLGREEGR